MGGCTMLVTGPLPHPKLIKGSIRSSDKSVHQCIILMNSIPMRPGHGKECSSQLPMLEAVEGCDCVDAVSPSQGCIIGFVSELPQTPMSVGELGHQKG